MAATSRNPFDNLPIETNQHIASFLEYDNDICNFRLICRSTLDAVDADNFSFWRRRFVKLFEDPGWTQSKNERYKSVYQYRRAILKNGAVFKLGQTRRERKCLEVLRDIITESLTYNTTDRGLLYESRNIEHVERFLLANNILQIIFKPFGNNQTPPLPTSLLLTIQVLSAPMLLSFEPYVAQTPFQFPTSQSVAYSTATAQPIFGGPTGLEVNMAYVLHNINFWKYHMTREEEHTLFPAFSSLEAHERPRWWSSGQSTQSHRDGQILPKLGKHWKGSYAYLDHPDLHKVRYRPEYSVTFDPQILDYFSGEEKGDFQDLTLHLVDDPDSPSDEDFPWPLLFEHHLRSLTLPQPSATYHMKTRAQKRSAALTSEARFESADAKSLSFRFDGEGMDVAESFRAAGWLNPLPPQNGVPGWRRMTMMKFFEDEGNETGVDIDALWAYEGVVLPGGKIMIGRWWSPDANGLATGGGASGRDVYSGPFILWCVDGDGV